MMTTHTYTQLQELALAMPCFMQRCTRQLSGAELLEMGYTQWHGERLDPERTYTVTLAKQTNQVRMLARIYKAGGYTAVLKHVYRYVNTNTPDHP